MTQEARDIARAFAGQKSCLRKRTYTNGREVYLYDSRIAWYDDNDMVWLTLAGWPTVTTRDRLNAICVEFGMGRMFHQRNYAQYFGDEEISSRDVLPLAGPLAMQAVLAERRERGRSLPQGEARTTSRNIAA